ncbi:fatty acid synthase S-acetyltransferase [Halenospora varia]|nr:fatty acid synthase S-acetyltransferase [Halenospora varia]
METNTTNIINQDSVPPVAVIGLSLKFPQEAVSVDSFWDLLMNGRSAMTEVPRDRFNVDSFYYGEGGKTGTVNARGGHFIEGDLGVFDAPFFSISASEAACLDPQQRWLLEMTYHALENAGVPLEQAVGSNTSVYVGSFMRDYETLLAKDTDMPIKYKSTGVGTSILANRISWFYDFKGPSMALDTACSSSLMALHLACQSIRSGESTMAIVAGCNLILGPETSIGLSDLSFLSPDSKCYSFDSRANGYSRGEGIGVVVLKALAPAIKNDTIRAVIRNTGTNQDGRTPGITQPSSEAQEALIRETYQKAGLDMSTTDYFEAHGTGTSVGDPLELKAIYSAFKDTRPTDQPLLIGAVKSNIGHLEGASGIAGLIKTILTLERGIIPPNINYEQPNSKFSLSNYNVEFPLKPTLWPSNGLRRASLNSFGFGGSNVHAILDDAHHYLQAHRLKGRHCTTSYPQAANSLHADIISPLTISNGRDLPEKHISSPRLLVFSSSDESGIARFSEDYKRYFETESLDKGDSWLDNLTYTICQKRSLLPWRSFATASSVDDLSNLSFSPAIRVSRVPKLSFVFTGQGAQWEGMGRELLSYPVFRRSLEDTETYFKSLGCQWSLLDTLTGVGKEPSDLDSPELSQAVTTALQIALVDLLATWGIKPKAVVGHSSGEIAAAYCAGISRSFALRLAYYRGLVSASIKEGAQDPGAMMAVSISATEIEKFLSPSGTENIHDVAIGCINSPNSITLSGSAKGIDSLQRILEEDGIHCRKLRVGVAYHSRYMKAAAFIYRSLIQITKAERYDVTETQAPMVSSVTGREVQIETLQDPQYWVHNMLSTVRFADAAGHLCAHSSKNSLSSKSSRLATDFLVEIGPHSALQGPLREILNSLSKTKQIQYGSVLVRKKSAAVTALELAGRLHTLGSPIDLMKVNNLSDVINKLEMITNLPSYPFNHSKRYWTESRISKAHRLREHPAHELLGTRSADWNPLEAKWGNRIIQSESPFVKDHKVNGLEVYPAAGMLCMAIEGIRQLDRSPQEASGYRLKDVSFSRAMVLTAEPEGTETQLYIRPSQDVDSKTPSWHEFRICTFENGEWQENCRGAISIEYVDDGTDFCTKSELEKDLLSIRENFETGATRCKMTMPTSKMYEIFSRLGLEYGPSFRSVSKVRFNDDGEAVGKVDLRAWASHLPVGKIQPHAIHPAALDGILQTGFPAVTRGGKDLIPTMVPTKVRSLWISAKCDDDHEESDIEVYTKGSMEGFRTVDTKTIGVRTSNGEPYITGDFEMTFVSGKEMLSSQETRRQLLYNFDWKPDVDLLDSQTITKLCSSPDDVPTPPQKVMANEKELLCYATMARALRYLDQSQLPSSPHIQRYLEWMKYRVGRPADDYLISSVPTLWQGAVINDEELEALYSAVEACDAEGQILVRIARKLQGILEGKVDALELLFKDDIINDYYRTAQDGVLIFTKTTRYVDIMAHKNPALRVLEIGAGTGGATGYIMDALTHHGEHEAGAPRFAEYTYTDVSPSFFEHAKDRFKNNRMTFRVLDIERDPKSQGFETGSYDLIIAANVIHATSSIDTTLQHARQLLKPGGKLILYEGINPNVLRTGFIFGVLPGWWLSKEKSRRWGPLLTVPEWGRSLSDNQFSGADVVLSNYDDPEYQVCSAIISTAVVVEDSASTSISPVFIISSGSSIESPVAQKLQALLSQRLGKAPSIISVQDIESADLTDANCIFLPELHKPFLHNVDEMGLKAVQKIINTAQGLLWLTRKSAGGVRDNPTRAAVIGIARSVLEETQGFKFVTLELEDASNMADCVDRVLDIFGDTLQSQKGVYETEYEEHNGTLCVNRIIEADYVRSAVFPNKSSEDIQLQRLGRAIERPLKLSIGSVGLLDTLLFVDDPIPTQPLGSDEIEVEIKAYGLNFRDVIIALGQLPYDQFGNECAGIVRRVGDDASKLVSVGERVACGLVGAFNTYARCKVSSARKIPDHMGFGEAAAMTIVFCTAHYALSHWARLQKGESILIHSGAGGLGQATVQLAQLIGAEVFITVGSEEKKQHMMKVYNIPEDHIFSSRTLAFAKGIKRLTGGRGVDVAINSLAGEGLRSSWECIAPFGRFIEVGKKDIYSQKVSAFEGLPMFPFAKNIMFASVDLAFLMEADPVMMAKLMADVTMMSEKKEIFVPQPLNVFSCGNIEQALRLMQSGKHMGKIVIELNEDDMIPVVAEKKSVIKFDGNSTYLIAGGLGGLGRSMASWMVDHGAKNLILLSRSKTYNEEVAGFLEGLRDKGVVVATPPCDVSDRGALQAVLDECSTKMPPVKGCIQGSMVIQNAMFANMTAEQLSNALRPKIDASWNLHELLPRNLDFFILLSSYAGVIGSVGQSNYAAGNTYQDALARYRVEQGEKAVVIDLGAIESVGFLFERPELASFLESTGHMGMSEGELLALIEYYCDPSLPVSSLLKSQVVTCLQLPSTLRAKGVVDFSWLAKPMFSQLYQIEAQDGTSVDESKASDLTAQLEFQLRNVESLSDAAELICEGLKMKLARVLGIERDNLDDSSRPTHSYGVDSLVAVELRNWFKKAMGADVAVFDILGNDSMAVLSMGVAEKSEFVRDAVKKAGTVAA